MLQYTAVNKYHIAAAGHAYAAPDLAAGVNPARKVVRLEYL